MSFREFRAILWRLLGYLRPYWLIVMAAFVCTFVMTVAKLSQAWFIGQIMNLMATKQLHTNSKFVNAIIDYASGRAKLDPNHPIGDNIGGVSSTLVLNVLCLAFLTMMVMMGVFNYFMRYWANLGGQMAIRDLRAQVFSHVQRPSPPFLDRMRLGEIHSRSSGDISTATQVYLQLADFLNNFFLLVIALGLMFYKDTVMTLAVLLLSPLIAVAIGSFGNRIGRVTESLQSRIADLSAIMYESMSSIKVVKAFNREEYEIERFQVKNNDSYDTNMALVRVGALRDPVVEFLGAFGIVAIIWLGARRIMAGTNFGEIAEYWTFMVMTTQPINALSGFYSTFQASAAAGKRVFEILDTPVEAAEGETLPPIQGRIDFEDVHFHYEEDKPVLRGLDLHIQAGEVIAIVGANGAGKTTLVNMVSRFYSPTSGTVRIDGMDLDKVNLRSLRSQIGVVIQESILFSGSITENIACGDRTATQEQILAASRLANAHEFIDRLPDGYNTQIGERGMRLSGGQRQRIAIARALLRDPRILILDEFTSGIDAESENLITDAIEKSMKGRTCLVIAHRLNTIRHADRILCLEAGRIAEQGSHAELMARDGIYAKIYQAQLQAPSANVAPEQAMAV